MKTVLVTGAAGSLGKALVAILRQDVNTRVVATSHRFDDASDLQLDVCDREQLDAAINQTNPDLVLHLAATFTHDFDDAYAVNVRAAQQLLEAVLQSGRGARVLLIGSAAEYGVVQPDENPIHENRVLNPVSIYGLTKAWQTQLAGVYAGRGVDVVVARIFNLDGPGLSERLFIGRLQKQIDAVLAGRQSAIELGPLCASRDYVSIDEAAKQVLAIAAHAVTGRVYHVASGVPIRMRDLLAKYLAIHNLDASIVRENVDLTNRVGYDVPAIYADVTSTMALMKIWSKSVKA